jgi:DNA-damage-inducible protein J
MFTNHEPPSRLKAMSETIIFVPIDESAKQHAEAALARLGLTPAEVLRRVAERLAEADQAVALAADDEVFLDRFREAIERLGREIIADILEPRTPNAETIEAIEELERGGGKSFASVEELMADLNSDADD